jgi:regulator of protease activity HflC (stomatin/prohibitin superfamily)
MTIAGKIRLGGFAVVALVTASVFLGSWYTVDERERAVVLRNGAIATVANPGLNFKLPYIDQVVEFSMESKKVVMDKVSTYSRDQQPAEILLSVNYSISEDPERVKEIYSRFGSLAAVEERVIRPRALQQLKNVFGQFNAETAVRERRALNVDVLNAIKESIGDIVIIESAQIENIDYDDVYEKAIQDRMNAEVEVQKIRQNGERAKEEAKIVVTRATAEADAVRQRATADAEAIKIKGLAEAEAITARGKAVRENAGLVELQAVEKWDGKLPVTMVPGSTVPFIGIK